jgi:prolipoprotein diacylglyceryltransferase
MQTGANGLVAICINGCFTLVLTLVMKDKNYRMGFVAGFTISLFCIFMYSWEIWASFLRRATEEMYCIEAAMEIDVIYCLLPVFLGLWRLAWSVGRGSDPVLVA